MSFTQAVHAFFVDQKLQAAVSLIVLDFIVGVAVAVKTRTFRLSYLGNFARTDVVKLGAWLAVYVGVKLGASNQQITVPGLGLDTIATAMWAALVASWGGSILGSLSQLGFSVANLAAVVSSSSKPEAVTDTEKTAG